MKHPVPIEELPEAARKPLGGPAPLRMMVAKGMAPLPPVALVSALYALSYDADEKLNDAAKATWAKLPDTVLGGALASPDLPAAVLDALADAHRDRRDVLEKIVQHASTATETVARIAKSANESLSELIALNEQRLLSDKAIIEALYFNPSTRMSTADRMVELAARNGLELDIPSFKEVVASLRNALIPEAGEQSPGDDMFRAAITEAEGIDVAEDPAADIVHRDDEGEETLKENFETVKKRLEDMTMSEKVRVAVLGSASQRMILVRSPNRAVARAAITSPRVQESEVVKISSSRSVGEDVLRVIADRRDWVRHHQVKVNLVFNPKTPPANALRLLPFLRESDLKSLQRSKNVTQALKTAASQLLSKRAGKG